jgi:excisionase family DNA binding protein
MTVSVPRATSTQSAEAYEQVLDALADGDAQVTVGGRTPVSLPGDLVDLLAAAADALAHGRGVTLETTSAMLTTQEAAEILGVSRPTMVRILDAGKVPFERPGSHRRIPRDALLAYADTVTSQRRDAMAQMRLQSSEDPDPQGHDEFVATR